VKFIKYVKGGQAINVWENLMYSYDIYSRFKHELNI
jgi:hypothetical protein